MTGTLQRYCSSERYSSCAIFLEQIGQPPEVALKSLGNDGQISFDWHLKGPLYKAAYEKLAKWDQISSYRTAP